ncbi:MAG: hypothetical protein MR270_05475 [Erysipelotrichaceae bacterium]|nr:hypothetical protein [Erysipelotrichaceae bacterium]
MLTIKEFDALQNEIIEQLGKRRFTSRYKEIMSSIKELNMTSLLCKEKKLSYRSALTQVRFIKGRYSEELKEIMMQYQELIFPDFNYKNDINIMINGPYVLKMWLVRYLCLKSIKCSLNEFVNIENVEDSITQQYQYIDQELFLKYLQEIKR